MATREELLEALAMLTLCFMSEHFRDGDLGDSLSVDEIFAILWQIDQKQMFERDLTGSKLLVDLEAYKKAYFENE